MFSALKHEGKPLYEYARKGIVIERKPRDITITPLILPSFDAPKAVIDVRCSKGTYIRTLSEDIAKHIGTFAHLTALRRTETAGFTIRESHTLDALAELNETECDALLLPCDVLVRHLLKIELNDRAVTISNAANARSLSRTSPPTSPSSAFTTEAEHLSAWWNTKQKSAASKPCG